MLPSYPSTREGIPRLRQGRAVDPANRSVPLCNVRPAPQKLAQTILSLDFTIHFVAFIGLQSLAMVYRRSDVYSLLNSTETPPGFGLGSEPTQATPTRVDFASPSTGIRDIPRGQPALAGAAYQSTTTAPNNGYGAQPPQDTLHGPPTLLPLAQTVGNGFPISVDTYSASKKTRGIRQKNAEALASYCRRKAAEEKSMLAELQETNRYLVRRIIYLTRQKQFYREERRVLRELMIRVPGLEDVAMERPDSP